MWRPWISSRLSADMLALQSSGERAGFAHAGSFGSSDELEAAVISRGSTRASMDPNGDAAPSPVRAPRLPR
jgi:hypothetical protein